MNGEAILGQFGQHFQETVVKAMIVDQSFAEQMLEVFDHSYLDLNYLSFLMKIYFDYAKKYKVFPTMQMLLTIAREELKVSKDTVIKDQVIRYISQLKQGNDINDLQYVKDKTLDFCKKQALKQALIKVVDQIEQSKYEAIVDTVKSAVMVGTTPALGHNFMEDIETRFVENKRICVATGTPELDQNTVLNGGLAQGELGIIIGASGAGKCVFSQSKLNIKYVGIKINGKQYRPWDKVNTKRGQIFAKDVVGSDELC